jgi:hypothetical protein
VVLVGGLSGALKLPVIAAVAMRSKLPPSKWLLSNVA